MIIRYFFSITFSGFITCMLFFLMLTLIKMGKTELGEDLGSPVIDFVRLQSDSSIRVKKRILPQKKPTEAKPVTPSFKTSTTTEQSNIPSIKIQTFEPTPQKQAMSLAGSPHLGSAPSDTDILPLVRVQPIYPRTAAQRKIEGWVQLQFTVTKTGTVKDVYILDANPPNIFNKAAKRAVKKWKYKQRIKNNKPIETPGVKVKLTFKLEDIK